MKFIQIALVVVLATLFHLSLADEPLFILERECGVTHKINSLVDAVPGTIKLRKEDGSITTYGSTYEIDDKKLKVGDYSIQKGYNPLLTKQGFFVGKIIDIFEVFIHPFDINAQIGISPYIYVGNDRKKENGKYKLKNGDNVYSEIKGKLKEGKKFQIKCA